MTRTIVAAILLAAAVVIPCVAWYLVGSRSVDRESTELVAEPERLARRTAVRLADRTSERLASIVRLESRRPYHQYRHSYPDLTENCECAGWIESPLASGPADPFLLAHFEIDPQLRLTLPTIPHGDASYVPGDLAQDALHAELQDSAPALAGAARSAEAAASPPARLAGIGGESVEVGPFAWHGVELFGRPEIVALRSVRTGDGSSVQGFMVSTEAVWDSFQPQPLPATLRLADAHAPAEAGRIVTEPLSLAGVSWEVAVDAGAVLADARRRASTLRGDFRRLFAGGTGAAALAAVLVLVLVGKSERLARQRARFAAAAAHELRTPLAGLRVHGEMLAEGLGNPESTREYARQIATEAERLGRVVSNVLEYTRLERGGAAVSARPSDAGVLAREAEQRLRPVVEAHGASLELDIAPELPRVSLDPDAFYRIVQNLVDNAERYGRDAEDRSVTVSLSASRKGGVDLSVADRGPGIPARAAGRVFRPFQRGEVRGSPAGLGLGLAMVAGLARAHGGSVRHRSREGGGSVFTVTFPA